MDVGRVGIWTAQLDLQPAAEAREAAADQRLLADASGGRFLRGLGVSHAPMVEGMLGEAYDKPLARMRRYLEAMDEAFTVSPPPATAPPRVLAALGPNMLRLAAEQVGAGADHVCVQVLDADVTALPLPAWRELAPALLGG